MRPAPRNVAQLTLAECLVAMTAASFFIWLVIYSHPLLVAFVPPAVIYTLWETRRSLRGRWSLNESIRIAILSALVAAPLTGVALLIQPANEGLFTFGFAAFLFGTLTSAFYGLMPAFTALVIYFFARDIFFRVRDARRKASKDRPDLIVESRFEGDPVKVRADADEAEDR